MGIEPLGPGTLDLGLVGHFVACETAEVSHAVSPVLSAMSVRLKGVAGFVRTGGFLHVGTSVHK